VKNRPQTAEVGFLKTEPRKPSFRFLNFEVGSVVRKPISDIFVQFRTSLQLWDTSKVSTSSLSQSQQFFFCLVPSISINIHCLTQSASSLRSKLPNHHHLLLQINKAQGGTGCDFIPSGRNQIVRNMFLTNKMVPGRWSN